MDIVGFLAGWSMVPLGLPFHSGSFRIRLPHHTGCVSGSVPCGIGEAEIECQLHIDPFIPSLPILLDR